MKEEEKEEKRKKEREEERKKKRKRRKKRRKKKKEKRERKEREKKAKRTRARTPSHFFSVCSFTSFANMTVLRVSLSKHAFPFFSWIIQMWQAMAPTTRACFSFSPANASNAPSVVSSLQNRVKMEKKMGGGHPTKFIPWDHPIFCGRGKEGGTDMVAKTPSVFAWARI